MLSRIALLILSVLLTSRALADDGMKAPPAYCRSQSSLMRRIALQDAFDVPPTINALIANVIDGRLPQVRKQLSAMPATDASRWRQAAMIIATYAQEPAFVGALLHDGAAINEKSTLPGLKRAFHDRVVDQLSKNPGWAAQSKLSPDASAVLALQGGPDGPALFIATQCGDVPTMNILLGRNPDVDMRPASNSVNALEFAVSNRNATTARLLLDHGAKPDEALGMATILGDPYMVQLLLDHDAEPCHANLGIHAPGTSLVGIGKQKGLPDRLIKRLVCSASNDTH